MQWDKDSVPVSGSNIYPELIDRNMATYTNILQVTGRQPGMYTCTATDEDTLSISQSITVKG